MSEQTRGGMVKVWDPLVRIGHWVLVAAFFTAWFSGEESESLHAWAGYVVGGIVLLRVPWGFIGTAHARFADFVKGPGEVIAYLRSLASRSPRHYLGHNPAGGLMVVALLLSLSAAVWTGLELYAVEENAGPLAALEATTLPTPVPAAIADEKPGRSAGARRGREDEADEEFWEELHEFFTTLTLVLVGLHVAGVLASSALHRENLVRGMITGWKKKV